MKALGREVPPHLVDEILGGRCVAFVGAGFSANVPTWDELLLELAEQIGGATLAQVEQLIVSKRAFDFEAAGQLIRDVFKGQPTGERVFEERVHEAIQRRIDAHASEPLGAAMARRVGWLRDIPFAAILTTNYDQNLDGWHPEQARSKVLRGYQPWWAHAGFDSVRATSNRPRAIKLHGDANRDPDDNRIVLGKNDYRRLLYEDARYGNFLRSVFATKTVLFLGVSFTDAYLNELRSEVLSLLGKDFNADRPGIGYSVMADKSPEVQAYFREHEGVHVLNFDVAPSDDFSGFDEWLEAIHAATAPVHRLRQFLEGQTILWVDPNERNNDYGIKRLREDVGANVVPLPSFEHLVEAEHGGARLLISNFGYRPTGGAGVFDVLERVNRWESRPPVIVFADSMYAQQNRLPAIRRGAFEYACRWSELFELVERLFGRVSAR